MTVNIQLGIDGKYYMVFVDEYECDNFAKDFDCEIVCFGQYMNGVAL